MARVTGVRTSTTLPLGAPGVSMTRSIDGALDLLKDTPRQERPPARDPGGRASQDQARPLQSLLQSLAQRVRQAQRTGTSH